MELLDIFQKGDQRPAIADFARIIARNPNDAEAYNNRGIAYRKKGDLNRAIDDFTHAIALNPNDAKAYFTCYCGFH